MYWTCKRVLNPPVSTKFNQIAHEYLWLLHDVHSHSRLRNCEDESVCKPRQCAEIVRTMVQIQSDRTDGRADHILCTQTA